MSEQYWKDRAAANIIAAQIRRTGDTGGENDGL
jgi:hypothetical protein